MQYVCGVSKHCIGLSDACSCAVTGSFVFLTSITEPVGIADLKCLCVSDSICGTDCCHTHSALAGKCAKVCCQHRSICSETAVTVVSFVTSQASICMSGVVASTEGRHGSLAPPRGPALASSKALPHLLCKAITREGTSQVPLPLCCHVCFSVF